MADKVLRDSLSQPLQGATNAKVDINCGPGHLTVDRAADGSMLASGTLEYLEKQGLPARTGGVSNGQATLTLRPGSTVKSGFRFPWQGCWGGAYQWQVNLNPTVPSDITAHSDGGNMKLNLGNMAVTHLTVDNGGGSVDVALPENTTDLRAAVRTGGGNLAVDLGRNVRGSNTVSATSGAGNVVVRIPAGVAARIHANSGAGKVIVESSFVRIDKNTFQSAGYDSAANKVEITAKSGAGNVSVPIR